MDRTPSHSSEIAAPVGDAITSLLGRASGGDREAEGDLVRTVYAALRGVAHRALARRGASPTVAATDLVHDLYLKLVRERPGAWPDRRSFFAAFARAVHDRLVDRARRRARRRSVPFDGDELAGPEDGLSSDELLALRDALDHLDRVHPRAAEVLRGHLLLGATIPEIASTLCVGHATVERDLRFARTWLHEKLRP